MTDRSVLSLHVYPLKGAAGIDVDTMTFDACGPEWDRRWMVVDAEGGFVSQRQVRGLALVKPFLQGSTLRLEAPEMTPIVLPDAQDGAGVPVRVWTSSLEARAVGAEADAWISAALGGAYRMVFMASTDHRHANPDYAPGQRMTFADGYPVLVLTDASVAELGRRVGRPIPVERFRPNVVVSAPEPHEEDRWLSFRVGDAPMQGVKQCARCTVTTVDQATGEADPEGEPLRTLACYRRASDKVWFGLNAVAPEGTTVCVGDVVEVTEWGEVPAP